MSFCYGFSKRKIIQFGIHIVLAYSLIKIPNQIKGVISYSIIVVTRVRIFISTGFVLTVILSAPSSVFSADTVRIASIFAFSGVAASANEPSYVGVRYGVAEINKRGGILGKPIELVEFDTRSTPIGSKIAADQAVKANVVAIIGASWSSQSLAIAKIAQSAGIPMISPDSTNERVTKVGDYIFRVCYTDPFQGHVMAKFAISDLKALTASILIDAASDYSTGLADTFEKSFTSFGGKIDTKIYYKRTQDNFRDEFAMLRQAGSDVLFLPGHDESAKILLKAAHSGVKSIPIGCDGWSTHNFFKLGGNRVKHGYYSAHWAEGVESQRSQEFVESFKIEGQVLSTEALGYDAVLLFADAAERAMSLQPEDLKKSLKKTTDFQGVTGGISFNDFGDPIKTTVIMHIENGIAKYLKSITPAEKQVSENGNNDGVKK